MLSLLKKSLLIGALLALSMQAQADGSQNEVGNKAMIGLSNIFLGWLEFPKNAVNTYNDTNIAGAVSIGFFKGALHAVGRTGTGVVDLLSAPFVTKPLIEPGYVWENFSTETHYGPAFKPKK